MKTVFVLLICVLSCELGACMRASGTPQPAQMRSASAPASIGARVPVSTVILGVN